MHEVENYILCVTNNRNNSTHHWFEEKNSNFQYRRRKYWEKNGKITENKKKNYIYIQNNKEKYTSTWK